MLTATAHLHQENFPVAFAEHKEDSHQMNGNDTVYYVEWLDDSSEFPGLGSSTNENNLTTGNWELLQRKEFIEDKHTLVSVEDDAWSKLTTPDTHQLYANVAEKNAAELQPTKRNIQPLWTNISNKTSTKKKEDDEKEKIDEDTYQDDLAYELFDAHKSQSRRTNRLSNRRKIHDLKTVDIHVEGIFRLATSNLDKKTTVTWIPYEKSHLDRNAVLDTYVDNLTNFRVSNKAQALTFSARFTHSVKRCLYNYRTAGSTDSKRPAFPDNSEFSVQTAIVKQ